MRTLNLPIAVKDQTDEDVTVSTRITITVDPLVMDDFKRELTSIPIARIMEQKNFRSRVDAEAFIEGLISGGLQELKAERKASQKAEDDARILAFDAYVAENPETKMELAKQAVSKWAGCAEAYITLASLEESHANKIKLLEEAVKHASKQFKGTRFLKPVGYFWQFMETRPYMRARTALAFTLWEAGKRREAIGHLKALLELNPADNQGLRYHLLNWLLEFEPDASDVNLFCERYEEEPSAFGRYANVLWCYIRSGDCGLSSKALNAAVAANKYVPALLCGAVEDPGLQITRVVRGSELEAIAYYRVGGAAFRKAGGAIEWLGKNCQSLISSKAIAGQIRRVEPLDMSGLWLAREPLEISNLLG